MLAASSPILSWNCQDTTSLVIEEWLDKALESNCEGLMVKCCDDESTYEPNKRSNKWLKMKKDYLDALGDTLDLVVVGAWMGKGKRASLFGSFLVACYNEDTDDFETVARIGTGLREIDLEEIQRNLYDQGMCR
jgi:DNA ligase-1